MNASYLAALLLFAWQAAPTPAPAPATPPEATEPTAPPATPPSSAPPDYFRQPNRLRLSSPPNSTPPVAPSSGESSTPAPASAAPAPTTNPYAPSPYSNSPYAPAESSEYPTRSAIPERPPVERPFADRPPMERPAGERSVNPYGEPPATLPPITLPPATIRPDSAGAEQPLPVDVRPERASPYAIPPESRPDDSAIPPRTNPYAIPPTQPETSTPPVNFPPSAPVTSTPPPVTPVNVTPMNVTPIQVTPARESDTRTVIRSVETAPVVRGQPGREPVANSAPVVRGQPGREPVANSALVVREQPGREPVANSAPVVRMEEAGSGAPRITAKDLMAGMMTVQGESLQGKPLSLMELFNRQAGRAGREQAVAAYWSTAVATADFYQCQAELMLLEGWASELKQPGRELGEQSLSSLQATLTERKAAVAESRWVAVSAQQQLAVVLGLPAGSALPLPTDIPHTGTYHTYFQEIFSGRTAPAEAVLLNRLLPVEYETVLARTAATLAAMDYFEATADYHMQRGQPGLSSVLQAYGDWVRQKRALLQAVERYNRDIAKYALPLAPATATPQVLAGMLIKHPTPLAQSEATHAAWDVSATSPAQPTIVPTGAFEPTLAVPPNTQKPESPATGEIRSLNSLPLVPPSSFTPSQPIPVQPTPALRPSGNQWNQPTTPKVPLQAERRTSFYRQPTTDSAGRPVIRSVYVPPANAPVVEDKLPAVLPKKEEPKLVKIDPLVVQASQETEGAKGKVLGYFEALQGLTPAEQAAQLRQIWQGSRTTQEHDQPVTLSQCLAGRRSAGAAEVAAAFRQAAVWASRKQVWEEASGLISDLQPGLVPVTENSAPAMLAYRALSAGWEADRLSCQQELLHAQYNLTLHVGYPLERGWLLPQGSEPNSGELQQAAISARAASVVAFDHSRAEFISAYLLGHTSFELALHLAQQQLTASQNFVTLMHE